MNLRTYSAATMAEALQQVKRELGSDAVILHTRTLSKRRWMGLGKQELVEITAGTGVNIGARTRRPATSGSREPAATPRPAPRRIAPEIRRQGLVAATIPAAESPVKSLLQTPAAASAMVMGLSEEVNNLKTLVQDLVKETRASKAPTVPEDLFDQYLHLIENQVADELATDIVKNLRPQLRADHLKNTEFVRDRLAEQIEKMLPVTGPLTKTKTTGPHIVALIGPTGVGKTTTVAKLAANLKLRENKRIGLITIDTFRIAAVDQLKKYADILGSPLKVVNRPDELAEAIAAMQDCDFVLIDTAGRSPTDTMKLAELKNFLDAGKPDEVHLVLASTASQSCIESAVERFGKVRVDKIIFTKLDEAVHIGVVLNVIRKVNKSLSYVTTGQDVPDDIEVGKGRRLAQLILGGKL